MTLFDESATVRLPARMEKGSTMAYVGCLRTELDAKNATQIHPLMPETRIFEIQPDNADMNSLWETPCGVLIRQAPNNAKQNKVSRCQDLTA